MLTKAQIKQTIDELPEEVELDELIERLVLIDKIERARAQSRTKNVLSESEVDDEIRKWLK